MASLPEAPKGHELEDYFAALLQSTGHYVEKNIEEPNVLELDIVATDYRGGHPRSRLFEVKGTEPRFEDIFKVIGWMAYLILKRLRGATVDAAPNPTQVQFVLRRTDPFGGPSRR